MKNLLFVLISLCVPFVSLGQNEQTNINVYAHMKVASGKSVNVLIKKAEGNNLTFRLARSSSDVTIDQSKVSSLEFILEYDKENLLQLFNAAEYKKSLAILIPLLEPYMAYMKIENNLHRLCGDMLQCYYALNNLDKARELATLISQSNNEKLAKKASVYLVLIALKQSEAASNIENYISHLTSEPAKQYVQVEIMRKSGDIKGAMDLATDIILKYGNMIDWMPRVELLCAELYVDFSKMYHDAGQTDLEASNLESAIFTASQVMNLYKGTHIAGDAEKLMVQLQNSMDQK